MNGNQDIPAAKATLLKIATDIRERARAHERHTMVSAEVGHEQRTIIHYAISQALGEVAAIIEKHAS